MQIVNQTVFLNKVKANKCKILISIFWISGLLTGKYLAQICPWNLVSTEAIANCLQPSSRGIIMIAVSILIGCACCIFGRHLLYIFLFLKAIVYSLASTDILRAFGEAGWLVWILLLLTDTGLILILLLFSIRSVGERFDYIMKNAALSVVAALILIFMDSYIIVPFTDLLLNS